MGSLIDTARAAWSAQRHDDTAGLREAARAIVRSGVTTLGGIAKALQAQGIKTPAGVSKWHRAQVSRLLAADAAAPLEVAEQSTKVSMSSETGDDAANKQLNGRSSEDPTSAADAVAVEITADHVFLPTGDDGNVGPDWETAGITERVKQGRRLMVPRDLAESLQGRKQAVILPAGASIPVYFRPGTPSYRP